MARFRTKPFVIDAVQYLSDADSFNAIIAMGCPRVEYETHWSIPIDGIEVEVSHGDYVVMDCYGDFHCFHPGFFEAYYEPVEVGQNAE